jgi:hypothetical protein
MPDYTLDTPVLFLIFNRPDTTQVVFDEIRKAKPAQLFVAADGPRSDRPDDIVNCRKSREIIRQVNWDCKVTTLFRDENLGCKKAISSAIDWFFSLVDEGIILEDDCVPDQSFFPFCQELLQRHRTDERVMMIAGMNYLPENVDLAESYYFSRNYTIWGWATWKRAWSLYDVAMSDWPMYNSRHYLEEIYRDKRIVSFLRRMIVETFENRLDTWDIQWVYACIFNHGLSICPKYNLISNIGNTGIHTKMPGPFHNRRLDTINASELVHPRRIAPNMEMDRISFNAITRDETVFNSILGFAYSMKKRLFKRD